MFCSECGTKIKKGELFCGNCGHKIDDTSDENKKINKKPKSKKNKILLITLIIICAILGCTYKYFESLASPKRVVKDYVKALINNDYDKLYSYLDIEGDNTFVSKKIFKELYKDSKSDTKILDYSIGEVKYSDSGLTASVKVSVSIKGSSNEDSSYIKLKKAKGKKYFFFKKWIVDIDDTVEVVKDYQISVLKGAKLYYSGLEVKDKYKDKKLSNDENDVYILPIVFEKEAKVKAILKNGLEIENKVRPYTDNEKYTLSFSKNSISKEQETKLLAFFKTTIEGIYNDIIEGKDWESVKSKYEREGLDTTKLKDTYEEYLNIFLGKTTKLTKIEFGNNSLYDIDITKDGYLEVEVKQNFTYETSYTSVNGDVETKNKNSYDYMTLYIGMDKEDYYLTGIHSIETYFY